MTTKKARRVIRAFLLSPEVIAFAASGTIAFHWPEALASNAASLLALKPPEVFAVFAAAVALTGCTAREALLVLRPGNRRSAMHSWPGYWKLLATVQAGLLHGVLGTLSVLASWFLYGSDLHVTAGFLVLAGFSSSAIALATTFHARLVLTSLLDQLD